MKNKKLYDGSVPSSKDKIGNVICNSTNASFQYDYIGSSLTLSIEMSVDGVNYEEMQDVTITTTADKKGIINIQDLTINTKLRVMAVGDGTITLNSLF